MMHGMYGFGSIWMIAFLIILIIFGIYLLMKFVSGDNKNTSSKDNNKNTPLQILQERLAKGEIDEAEYERLKLILKRDRK